MPARGRSKSGGSRFVSGIVVGVLVSAILALIVLLRTPPRRVALPEAAPPTAAATSIPRETAAPSRETAAPSRETVKPSRETVKPSRETVKPSREAATPTPVPATATARVTGTLPRVAIVLDDCGQRLDLLERAIRSPVKLTLAVIPHLPHSRESAERAHAAGQEVIVHQPMEPDAADENPGVNAIIVGMHRDRITRILKESFADVPHAVGLNNHMGSRATSNAGLMEATFSALEKVRPGAVFLDSRTTAATVALDVARRKGIRAAQRSVFLDNDLDAAAIRSELERLAQVAAEEGEAVAIGHLKAETLSVLEAVLPAMAGRDCTFVFLSDLVR